MNPDLGESFRTRYVVARFVFLERLMAEAMEVLSENCVIRYLSRLCSVTVKSLINQNRRGKK